MRAREISNCSREENTKYTVEWDPSQRWRTEVRPLLPDRRQETGSGRCGRPCSIQRLVEDTVFQLIGGLRSGMGYCGAKDVETLKETGKFVKISAASLKESHPHDIHITKEAPNYSVDDK